MSVTIPSTPEILSYQCLSSGNGLLNDILSYWKCDETSGTVLSDSRSNIDLSTSATVNADGRIEKAVDLQSTGVSLSHVYNVTTNINYEDFSYSLWIYPNQIPSSAGRTYELIVCSEEGIGNIFHLSWGTSGYISAGCLNYLEAQYYTDSAGIYNFTNQWVHLVIVYSLGSKMQLYVNNSNVTASWSTTCPLANYTHSEGTIFGNLSISGTERTFDGKIDEIGMWKKALTADEVSLLYNDGNGLNYNYFTI
jgi:hypothetical protein